MDDFNDKDNINYNDLVNKNNINHDIFSDNNGNIFTNNTNIGMENSHVVEDINQIDLASKVIDNFSVFPNSNVKANVVNETKEVKEEITTLEPVTITPIDNNNVDNNNGNENTHKYGNIGVDNYVFTDGLDEITDDKYGIKRLLINRKFLLIVSILAFVSVCIVVTKAFYFGKKARDYEEVFLDIEKREEEYIKVSEGKEIDSKILDKVAASELVSCINSTIDTNNLPDSIKSVINEINSFYSQSNNYFSFKYEDIYTGFSVSYNENQGIFGASTIKAPTDIYLWEMASLGKVNLDDKLTYTSRYYNDGSGILKSKPFNTSYTIRELLKLSTVNSDNAAHNMLVDKYGRENMLNFWKEKGTNTIFTNRTNWGPNSAHDAAIYLRELYNFYLENDEYGKAAMTNFLNSSPKFLDNGNGYEIANKFGWSGSVIHDAAIIFADNPYILVTLSNLGDKSYNGYFSTARRLGYKLHTEYWKYKISSCEGIKQY